MKKPRMKNVGFENGETRVFKTRVPGGFFSTSATTPYKSRIKNSIFILELEF